MNDRLHHPMLRSANLSAAGPTDADLLVCWAADRDEGAFELLLHRHAPLVIGACRRILSDPNDADDAFQAVFLVLARKAGSIAQAEMVAAWLHRVAVRIALRMRSARLRRSSREEPGVERLAALPLPGPGWVELSRVLDEEVAKLPTRQRTAFVLCCLEGKTGEEAARLLGCPPGTVSSRLTRARERLRERLTCRGFAPAVLAVVLASDALIAMPPLRLVNSTLTATLAFTAGSIPCGPEVRSVAIAEGVLRTMTLTKLRLAALFLITGLLAAGAVLASTTSGTGPDQPPPPVKAADNGKGLADPPTIRLIYPQAGGLDPASRLPFPCSTEPAQQADLYPGVTGIVKAMTVDLGDRVKKGQLLAEIDAPALVLDERLATNGVLQAACLLREAQARVSGTVAEVVAAQGAVRLREAEVTTAKVSLESWKKQCDRLKQLSDNNAVPQQTVNEAQNHYLAAEAQVAAAVAGVENGKANVEIKKGNMAQAEAAVETAKANVEAAKLGLEKARLALSQTRVTAPFDGIVTRRNLSAGDFVRPDQSTAIHSQLFTLVRVDVIRVVVEVPEQGIPLVEPGVLAEVTFHALPESRFTGKVARVGFVASPKTGTMRAEIDVPNPGGKLRPGMSGVAELKLGKGNVGPLRVPVGAVLTHLPPLTDENANAAVYVYRDGKARLTRVRVGKGDGKETEVISGLTAEDRVVVNPVGLLPPALQEIPVRVEAPEPKK